MDFITTMEINGGDYITYLDTDKSGFIGATDASLVIQKALDYDFLMDCEK